MNCSLLCLALLAVTFGNQIISMQKMAIAHASAPATACHLPLMRSLPEKLPSRQFHISNNPRSASDFMLGYAMGDDACSGCQRKTKIKNALKILKTHGYTLQLESPAHSSQSEDLDAQVLNALHDLADAGVPIQSKLIIPGARTRETLQQKITELHAQDQKKDSCLIL